MPGCPREQPGPAPTRSARPSGRRVPAPGADLSSSGAFCSGSRRRVGPGPPRPPPPRVLPFPPPRDFSASLGGPRPHLPSPLRAGSARGHPFPARSPVEREPPEEEEANPGWDLPGPVNKRDFFSGARLPPEAAGCARGGLGGGGRLGGPVSARAWGFGRGRGAPGRRGGGGGAGPGPPGGHGAGGRRALGLRGAGSRDASCLGDRPGRAVGACGRRGVFARPGAPGERLGEGGRRRGEAGGGGVAAGLGLGGGQVGDGEPPGLFVCAPPSMTTGRLNSVNHHPEPPARAIDLGPPRLPRLEPGGRECLLSEGKGGWLVGPRFPRAPRLPSCAGRAGGGRDSCSALKYEAEERNSAPGRRPPPPHKVRAAGVPAGKRGAAGLAQEPPWPRAAAPGTRLPRPQSVCGEGSLVGIGDQPMGRVGQGVGEGRGGRRGERSVTPQGDSHEWWLPLHVLSGNPSPYRETSPKKQVAPRLWAQAGGRLGCGVPGHALGVIWTEA